jgi:hypothetical protein
MSGALLESPSHAAFKFNQSFKLNIFLSLLLSPLAFVLTIGFAISHVEPEILSYDGLLTRETSNLSYLSVVLPVPRSPRFSYLVLIDLDSLQPDSFYSISAEMFCQWFDMPAKLIHRRLPNISVGNHPLFQTSIASYRSLLLLIHIEQLSGFPFSSARVTTLQSSPAFRSDALSLRVISSILSAALAAFYTLAVAFLAPANFQSQQLFTIASLAVAALANFPLAQFLPSMRTFLIECALCGALSSLNLICLVCFLQAANSRNFHFVLPISGLFLMARVMLIVTSDTTVLSHYFDNNHVVWVFFFSVTAIATAGYALLLISRLLLALCRARTTQKHLFVAYTVAAFVALVSAGVEFLMVAIKGFCPFAIEFAVRYPAQTLLAVMYADVHWPLPTGEIAEDQEQLRSGTRL